jgi:hypothetical protein
MDFPPGYETFWTMGDNALWTYYQIYDYENKRLALTETKSAESRLDSLTMAQESSSTKEYVIGASAAIFLAMSLIHYSLERKEEEDNYVKGSTAAEK